MPQFRYESISPSGEVLSGKETADSREEIIRKLREQQQYPTTVEEITEKDIRDIQFTTRVNIKYIAVFCRQFYTMQNAGVTIVNALDIMRQQMPHKRFRKIISEVYEDVQKGFTFSEALSKHPKTFPELMTYMVAAGEVSGNLDVVMLRMATHYEKEYKINSKIKSAMVYPMILSIVAIAVVVFLLTVVMPTFIGMFEGSGVPLPTPTRILLAISSFLQSSWYIVAGILLVLFVLFRYIASKAAGKRSIDAFKFYVPVFRDLTTKVAAARFTRTLSTLLNSGIPLLQALESVAGAVGNKVVADGIMAAREDIRKGIALSIPIRKLRLFPPMVHNMIKIGEESGTLDEILEKTANIFDEEVETEIQRLLTFVEPMMILIMGLVIGFIVISMVLPMFDMMQTI
ncbi:type IV pilus assembly protein PilC [Tindallia magadiensis]|uniref:Type IV pilus assembly protein PilC n=1 Tax=Tindallia magadiensis TaxID=69895 RepID=A0A1I3AC14_9FIRM|nr:type II secretion system F family protein [Tindallia magadiensis]SFH47627.1 type IV pilus assembly protein PilC [Tindallia magadiensis]